MSRHIHIRRWIIWGLAVAFYFYEYFIRVAPSAMANDLFRSFNIGAGILGIISASYFYAYAPMQLPVGVLMDRYGARKLLTIATLVCGVATLLFGIAPAVWVTIIARLFMGAGSAFAFIGMIYISSHWFDKSILARLIGVGNSIGMLGAVFGEGFFAELISAFNWRPTTLGLGLAGLVLGFTIFLIVRNDPKSMEKKEPKKSHHILRSMKLACMNKQTWYNGISVMLFYSSIVCFGGLWAIPFFQQTYGFSNETASFAASMIYLGIVVGGPILGHYSDVTKNRKKWLLGTIILSLIFCVLIIYTPIRDPFWVITLMFLFGVSLSGQLLNYCLSIELNTHDTKGAALAITNCLVFITGSLVQTAIGFILSKLWTGATIDGAPQYSLENYRVALSILPITLILAFFFALRIKEKKASKPRAPAK